MQQFFQRLWRQFGQKETGQRIATIAALIIFGIGLLFSAIYSGAVANQQDDDTASQKSQRALSLSNSLSEKINAYEQVLFTGSTLMSLQGDITQDKWQSFVRGTRLLEHYPDTLGVGYLEHVRGDQLDGYIEHIRGEGRPDYAVRPAGAREDYGVITYIEPQSPINVRAQGFDMYSESIRQQAITSARDNAQIVMSSPTLLIQDANNPKKPRGVLMFYPVYNGTAAPSTVAERRSTLKGYVYVVVRPGDLLQNNLGKNINDKNISISLTDVTDADPVHIYSWPETTLTGEALKPIFRRINVSNRTWELSITPYDTAVSRLWQPILILVLGTIFSGLLASVIFTMLTKRLQYVRSGYESEIQRTKDELLALASHQLRTPASGVKQYIGMLTQGFAGELTEEQREIANKAFAANERQIEIINELLYVAKADAGQLMMEPDKLDLVALTHEIINSVQDKAAAKNMKVQFRLKRPIFTYGDSRYIRMIVENMLTNAIKYSYANSTVTIGIRTVNSKILLDVKDHGVGIEDHDIEGIFDKFKRVENPLSREEGGSGLGLFLARELARAHHGNITVASRFEKGSTFTLTLPKYREKHTGRGSVAHLTGHRKS